MKNDWFLQDEAHRVLIATGVYPRASRTDAGRQLRMTIRGQPVIGGCCSSIVPKAVDAALRGTCRSR